MKKLIAGRADGAKSKRRNFDATYPNRTSDLRITSATPYRLLQIISKHYVDLGTVNLRQTGVDTLDMMRPKIDAL